MSEEVVAVQGKSSRAHTQCADIIIGEAANAAAALRSVAATLSRYPGCLVVAVRAWRGNWLALGARDRKVQLQHARTPGEFDVSRTRQAAHRCHEERIRS